MKDWKTTVNGFLAAIIGAAGPLAAYLATQSNPKAAWASGIVTLAATIARIWVGLLQNDAPPNTVSSVTTTTTKVQK